MEITQTKVTLANGDTFVQSLECYKGTIVSMDNISEKSPNIDGVLYPAYTVSYNASSLEEHCVSMIFYEPGYLETKPDSSEYLEFRFDCKIIFNSLEFTLYNTRITPYLLDETIKLDEITSSEYSADRERRIKSMITLVLWRTRCEYGVVLDCSEKMMDNYVSAIRDTFRI